MFMKDMFVFSDACASCSPGAAAALAVQQEVLWGSVLVRVGCVGLAVGLERLKTWLGACVVV